jgi:hypothetical protein
MERIQKLSSNPNERPELSTEFLEALGRWLALFSQHYRQELTDVGVLSYELALRDLTVEELNRGCDLSMQECEFMPRAADIRKRRSGTIKESASKIFRQIQASEAFEKACDWAKSNYSPEIPIKNPEQLPPSVEYAMRVAGGITAMIDAGQRYWVRKNFMEAYTDIREQFDCEGISTRQDAQSYINELKGQKAVAAGAK